MIYMIYAQQFNKKFKAFETLGISQSVKQNAISSHVPT